MCYAMKLAEKNFHDDVTIITENIRESLGGELVRVPPPTICQIPLAMV